MLLRYRTHLTSLLILACTCAIGLLPGTAGAGDCTHTFGWWKNHPGDWPDLRELMVGKLMYSRAQLLDILEEPVAGNGMVSLAHELIAAKLNVEAGTDPTDIHETIRLGDGLIRRLLIPPIGSDFLDPSLTRPVTDILRNYNWGIIGPGICETALGACCLPGGSCDVMSSYACDLLAGTYKGFGSTCETTTCARGGPPDGACCLSGGSCQVVQASECTAQGGTYQGDGTPCAPSPCEAPPTGACCLGGESCQVVTSAECTTQGGAYYGDDVPCDPTPCGEPPTGACCLGGELCQVVSSTECKSQGGAYYGDDVPCDPTPCGEPPTGACCLDPSGKCAVTTSGDCEAQSGIYVGDGTICSPATCAPTATEPTTWGALKHIYH